MRAIVLYSAVLSLAFQAVFVRAFAPAVPWSAAALLYCALGFLSCFLVVFTPLYPAVVLPLGRRAKTAAWIAIPFVLIGAAGLDAFAFKLFKVHLDWFVVSQAAYALWTGEVDPGRITPLR